MGEERLVVGVQRRKAAAARRLLPRPFLCRGPCRRAALGERWWYVRTQEGNAPAPLLFTENETNYERLFGVPNAGAYVKDGIHEAVVHGDTTRVNPAQQGTKVAAQCTAWLPPGYRFVVQVRFSDVAQAAPFEAFDAIFAQRLAEADEFYQAVYGSCGAALPLEVDADQRLIQRQAFAGLMWSKQFYHYSVGLWLEGDPAQPKPDAGRGRNREWRHLYNMDVHAMPDKWEYPWYAAWDTAFHTLPIAMIDPEWAKRQLILLLREWYMHPNGQIPAYEWAFGDVNPPVHAWAAWRVYQIDRAVTGRADTDFLERVFHKLLLNFTWWVNRKDHDGNNVFQGGFLGLDNIGVFDRSRPLPTGGHIDQADGTAWMGMYCLNLLTIALELARTRPAYEDVATKFFEHFLYIADALTHMGTELASLWDAEDGFFYDRLHFPDGHSSALKARSFVGLIPLFAVETLDADHLEALPHFRRRMEWLLTHRQQVVASVASLTEPGRDGRRLLALADRAKLQQVLQRMFDSAEFLSEYGLRSLSRYHLAHPYTFYADGQAYSVQYDPAESRTDLFGGNSNWRGPIWFPVNYLMIESLRKYAHYYGETFKVEVPTGSGCWMSLDEAATLLSKRLIALFLKNESGRRPVLGEVPLFQHDPRWQDYVPFYEYFHGDSGAGLGAGHQTGWTALVARLIYECGGLAP